MRGIPYTVHGYKGKQVRDNIHSRDVIEAFECFRREPRNGEVYNLGGGRDNSVSILEAISKIEELAGLRLDWRYSDHARRGDHICYISNLTKFKTHYPSWGVRVGLDETLAEIIDAERSRA